MDLLHLGLPYQARHLHRLSNREFRVRIKGVGEMTLRPKSADAAAVSQVFSFLQYDTSQFPQHHQIEREYRNILARGHRPLIVDLGANNGASARWFAKLYPQADIVAVEPDADNARMCRLNTQGYPVEVIQAAVGSEPGRVALDTSSASSVSFTTTRSADGDIRVVTVGEIVAERRADHELFIVKIDIEGFEEDLFSANTEWVSEAYVIMIEPHDQKFPEKATSRPLQETMAALDFQILISGENLVYVRSGHQKASAD
jgi:FkbM family methyltransferase